MTALTVAADGRWSAWHGLDADLHDGDVTTAFAVPSGLVEAGIDQLSHRARATRTVPGDGEPRLRWWLDDEGAVLLLRITDPAAEAAIADVLATLGAADREGPGRHLVFGGTTTEYVWAARGLSLTWAASYEDPPAFVPRLASASVFARTDLGGFIVDLGGDDRGGPRW
jgi:hypothetical protein